MPYIMTTSLYPSDKAPEVAEKYLEAITKYPQDENLGTLVIPAAVKATEDGIKVIAIEEVKEGKLEEALVRTAKINVMFHGITGHRYRTDLYLKIEEALDLIGMSIPE